MALTPILLDTNGYAAFKRGMPEALEIIQHSHIIGLTVVVLGELYAGFAAGSREQKNHEELLVFLQSNRVHVFEIDTTTSQHYANIYQSLRRNGTPIPQMICGLRRRQSSIVLAFLHMISIFNMLMV